jgi:GNAT superfamily N-acetyltransferase
MSAAGEARTWSVHLVDPAADRELLLRAQETFWGRRDQAYLDWLYYRNPAGPLHCAVALDGDTVAGQYIVVPIDLAVNGEPVKGSLSLDTYTHAAYRRQGIFTVLAEAVYARLAARSVLMTIGLPNDNSRPGFLSKLGFAEPHRARLMGRALSPVPGAQLPFGWLLRAAGRARGVRIAAGPPDPDALDALWDACRRRTRYGPVKDARWIAWRYLEHPRQKYRFLTASDRAGRLAGYAIWNEKPQAYRGRYRAITLMDVVGIDATTGRALIQAFLEAVAPEAHGARALAILGTPSSARLAAAGFVALKPMSFIQRFHDPVAGEALRGAVWPLSFSLSDTI